jgi:integrase/recombinase XerD
MLPFDLRGRLDDYLSLRRALGFEMRSEERLLRNFVLFVETRGEDGCLRAETAVAWACSTADRCGPGCQARRLSIVRGFLTFLQAEAPETGVPSQGVLKRPLRATPHIYSSREVNALLAEARRLAPTGSLWPVTFTTLIGLLLSTGLRVGEALRLQVTDVQLDEDPPRLVVTQTKFRKSRLVPLHSSAAEALQGYAKRTRHIALDRRCQAFFVSARSRPLRYHTVARAFRLLAKRIGLRDPAKRKRPTLHGFRHTFAVRRLLAWYHEGADINARLPELSIYLGHVRPLETYWYLTATPELLRLASDRFEAYVEKGVSS